MDMTKRVHERRESLAPTFRTRLSGHKNLFKSTFSSDTQSSTMSSNPILACTSLDCNDTFNSLAAREYHCLAIHNLGQPHVRASQILYDSFDESLACDICEVAVKDINSFIDHFRKEHPRESFA
jgi:hypothetical protein